MWYSCHECHICVLSYKFQSVRCQRTCDSPHPAGDSEVSFLNGLTLAVVYIITPVLVHSCSSLKKENVLVDGSSGALIQVPSILIWTKLFENGGRGEFSHFIWNLELLLDLQHDCLRSGVDSEKNGKGHNCLLQSGFYSFTNCQSGKEGKFWLWDNHRYDSLDDESSQDQTPLIKNWQNVVTEPQLGR